MAVLRPLASTTSILLCQRPKSFCRCVMCNHISKEPLPSGEVTTQDRKLSHTNSPHLWLSAGIFQCFVVEVDFLILIKVNNGFLYYADTMLLWLCQKVSMETISHRSLMVLRKVKAHMSYKAEERVMNLAL